MIRLKGVVMEDFCNYKKPSMFLITCFCNWKCCKELGLDKSTCQNSPMASSPIEDFSYESIYNAYIHNDISKAIVIGGLEPLEQFGEIYDLIGYFRYHGCDDDFVIYTGYTEDEVKADQYWHLLLDMKNIVFKFGRYVPGDKPHRDEVLGIELASDNQYGKRFN